jgi:hypothetical protein
VNLNLQPTLTAWSAIRLAKSTVAQALRKFPAIYGSQRFITVFKKAHDLSLS